MIGGATALIAVTGGKRIHDLGWAYILFPAILSSSIFVVLGFLLNNVSTLEKRKYPVHWLPDFPVLKDLNTSGSDRNVEDNSEKSPEEGNLTSSLSQDSHQTRNDRLEIDSAKF